MADPVTLATLLGMIVPLMTGYMQYRATVETAKQKGAEPPKKTKEIEEGEKAITVVKEGIVTHGNDDEKADLASFERNPERNANDMLRAIRELAARSEPFAQQLQTLAQQATTQTGSGVQGNVNASGQGKIQGMVAGVNQGEMKGEFHFSDADKD